MPKPAPEAVRTEAVNLRRQGWSCEKVAMALGVTPQVVGRWSKQANIVPLRLSVLGWAGAGMTPLEKARERRLELRAAGITPERLNTTERARRNPNSLRLAVTAKWALDRDETPGRQAE